MEIITTIIVVYALIFISLYLHEHGHRPKGIRMLKAFPLPSFAAMQAKSRYGGLMVNTAFFLIIWYLKPENIYLQLFGLINWIYVMFYLVVGSFNYEPVVPKELMDQFIFDDVKNEHAIFAVPLAFIIFWYLKEYYFHVFFTILGSL